MRRNPLRAVNAVAVLLAPGGLVPLHAQEVQSPRKPQDILTVIYTLRVNLEMETRLLGVEMEQYLRLEDRRLQLALRLETLYDELNQLMQEPDATPEEELAAKESEIGAAEHEETDVRLRLRDARLRIRKGRERIKFLQARLESFEDAMPQATESLTGSWEVTYMPSGDKGFFRIEQNGTLLGGEYVLEGGWKGSLQGTFVSGKVFLQRIDSRLGRSSTIEGYLSSDGKTIKGSWQNFDLTGPGPSSGAWTATKQEPASGEGTEP
jgi:hypothetical protein